MGWTVRGSNPGGGRDFPHLSRPALGPTQPPVQWLPGFFSRGKERPGRDADPSPPSSAVVMKGHSYTSTPPMGRSACIEPQCLYKGDLYLYILFVTVLILRRHISLTNTDFAVTLLCRVDVATPTTCSPSPGI